MRIEELDIKQLRDLANHHQLDFPPTANTAQMIKIIKDAHVVDPEKVVPVSAPEEGTVQVEKMDPKSPNSKWGKRIKVIFPNQDGVDNMPKISVTVNGYNWKIPREKVVELPPECLDVIDNAIVEELYKDESGVIQKKERRRFAYQTVRD